MVYVGIPTEVKIFKDYFGKILDRKIESLVMEITIFIYCVLTSKFCFYYISISCLLVFPSHFHRVGIVGPTDSWYFQNYATSFLIQFQLKTKVDYIFTSKCLGITTIYSLCCQDIQCAISKFPLTIYHILSLSQLQFLN